MGNGLCRAGDELKGEGATNRTKRWTIFFIKNCIYLVSVEAGQLRTCIIPSWSWIREVAASLENSSDKAAGYGFLSFCLFPWFCFLLVLVVGGKHARGCKASCNFGAYWSVFLFFWISCGVVLFPESLRATEEKCTIAHRSHQELWFVFSVAGLFFFFFLGCYLS